MESSDWRRLTAAEEKLVKSAGPDDVCFLFGEEIVCVHKSRMLAMYEHAFKSAAKAASDQLGLTHWSEVDDILCHDPEPGQAYMRVSVTDIKGRTESAVGMFSDPRAAS